MAKVVVSDINEQAASSVVNQIKQMGGKAFLLIRLDLPGQLPDLFPDVFPFR